MCVLLLWHLQGTLDCSLSFAWLLHSSIVAACLAPCPLQEEFSQKG